MIMTGVKAKLKVVLQADETVVAESDDAGLWQRVLLAINKGNAVGALDEGGREPESSGREEPRKGFGSADSETDDIGRLSHTIGVSREAVLGACSPARASPFLTLDMHCWNAMKEQTPVRGPGSISPMAVAATLLALWVQTAKLGSATQAEAQKVLATINLRDANAARSVQAAEWLQGRSGGAIVLNPARVKRAVAIAKAFCSQDWKSDSTWKGSTSE
jgi:hypothetical protein